MDQELFKTNTKLEEIYENLDSVESARVRAALEENKDMAVLCKKLATITRDADISFNLKKSKFDKYAGDLKMFFSDHKFKTLYKRIFAEELPERPIQEISNLQQTLF